MGVYRSKEITTVRSDARAATLITSVPASILRRFGCKKGDRLKWDVKEDTIVAKKIEEK